MTEIPDEREAGPGRPRDRNAQARILEAARALLAEGGVTAVTMAALAARARVGKPTLYRYWPNAHAVAMDALIDAPPSTAAPETDGLALDALRAQLRRVIGVFSTPVGRGAAALAAAASPDTELSKAFRHQVMLRSRSEGKTILAEAMARGEVRWDADMETALDLIYAPVFFRLLMGHAPLDAAFADKIVETVLNGIASR